jgi:hypothetical protein
VDPQVIGDMRDRTAALQRQPDATLEQLRAEVGWWYRAAGVAGLVDRSSAPRYVASRTADERVAVIVKLRQLRMTAAEIAETLEIRCRPSPGL